MYTIIYGSGSLAGTVILNTGDYIYELAGAKGWYWDSIKFRTNTEVKGPWGRTFSIYLDKFSTFLLTMAYLSYEFNQISKIC